MVVVNSILSLALLLGTLCYSYIYPKKRINWFFLLIIVSLLPVLSIFRKGLYESGDFNLHIYRAMAFYDAIKDGQLIPSWAGDLNGTYGYPLFIFLNPLPYYIISLFHFLGFTFEMSMKLFLAFSYVGSGITMYLFCKLLFKNNLSSFTTAVFYLFMPYHLVDLHFRVAIGEILFFTVLPLYFYFLYTFLHSQRFIYVLLTGFTFSLLFFTHQAMAVFSHLIIIPFILYFLFFTKNKAKLTVLTITTAVIGLLISASTWYPHLIYSQYTHVNILRSQLVAFPNISELLYTPWRMGFLFQGPKGELAYLLGYIQILVIIISVYKAFSHIKPSLRINKESIHYWLLSTFLLIFLISPLSSFLWQSIPILNTAQFSTRLLLLASFTISVLAGYLVVFYKNRLIIVYILILLGIGSTILNWGHRRVIPEMSDIDLKSNQSMSTYQGEGLIYIALPKWVQIHDNKNPWISTTPLSPIEIVKGNGEIKQIYKNSREHMYIYHAEEEITIKENTLYFPGWKAKMDYKTSIPLSVDRSGLIIFTVPKGLHYIHITYEDLTPLRILKYITISSIGFIMIYTIIYKIVIH